MPTLRITSPVKGINTVVPREGQPQDTCWSATNVLPYDRFGRHRVAQRPGLVKQWNTNLGSTFIQGMLPINDITYSGAIISTGGTSSTNVSTWINVPAGVTAGSTILFGSTSVIGANTGPEWTSTLNLSTGFTLNFNITYGGDTGLENFVWVYLDPSSTKAFSGSPLIQVRFDLDSAGFNTEARVTSSTLSYDAITSGTPSAPINTTLPCSITWTSTGHVYATLNGTSTDVNTSTGLPPGYLPVNFPSTGVRVYFHTQYNGVSNTGSTTISNIQVVAGGGSTSTPTGQVGYQTLVIAVEGGYVWVGTQNLIQKAANGQVTPQLSSTNYVSMAYESGVVYIVDGSSTVHTYTIATDTVGVLTASTGTVGGGSTAFYNLICNWRGRIVLAGDSGNPQLYYMSRAGEPKDWNYASTDSAAAFAGQLGKAGLIGEPIIALIPFSDDLLKIGCSHSMWMMQGDPADGGTITVVSNSMGIVGKDAWCIDPAGTLWFVATGGLYHVRPAWEAYRPPEPVTMHQINPSFRFLNPGEQRVILVYDPDLHYLHMFGSPPIQGAATHLTMDARSVGGDSPPAFWQQIFPDAMGPTAAVLFFGDGNPNNRTILMGGFDGYIRKWDEQALDDDGTAISAGITLGPFAPVPGMTAIIQGVTLDMGEAPVAYGSTAWNTNAIMSAGPSAYDVTEAIQNSQNPYPQPTINGLVIDRRQKTFRQRLRGAWFSLSLQNLTSSTFFSFESATIDFMPGGKERRQR